MEKLNEIAAFLERNPGLADCVVQITYSEMYDIAETFRVLEQRAEAAEVKLAELAKQKPVAVVEESDYATVVEMVEGNRRKAIRELQEGSLQLGMELFTRPAPAAVPDGWKLVPVEMTDDIGEAIAMEAGCCGGIALDIYDAALRAAPEPPAC